MLQSQIAKKRKPLKNCLSQGSPLFLGSRSIIIAATFFFIFKINAQQIANYVNNGGFENLLSHSLTSYYNVVRYWPAIDTNKSGSYLATTRSPIANAPGAFGFQYARTGDNYIIAQFFCSSCTSNPRSYPRNRLKQFLQAGRTYCVKFHIVNTNNTTLTSSDFGAYFANSSLDTITKCTDPITYLSPQVINPSGIIADTLNWIPITGTFVATGAEKYMVLGNFKSNVNTNTVLINPTYLPITIFELCIDDVSCIDVDLPAYAGPGPDTWCIPGDSVYLGRPRDVGIDEACMWYKLPDMTNAIDTAAGLWVKPIVTTTYVVKQEICAGIKYDTIVVHQSGVGLQKHKKEGFGVEFSPNPANNFVTLFSSLSEGDIEVEIFDTSGKSVYHSSVKVVNNQSKLQLDLQNGIYFVSISNSGNEKIVKKLLISK